MVRFSKWGCWTTSEPKSSTFSENISNFFLHPTRQTRNQVSLTIVVTDLLVAIKSAQNKGDPCLRQSPRFQSFKDLVTRSGSNLGSNNKHKSLPRLHNRQNIIDSGDLAVKRRRTWTRWVSSNPRRRRHQSLSLPVGINGLSQWHNAIQMESAKAHFSALGGAGANSTSCCFLMMLQLPGDDSLGIRPSFRKILRYREKSVAPNDVVAKFYQQRTRRVEPTLWFHFIFYSVLSLNAERKFQPVACCAPPKGQFKFSLERSW